MAKTKLKTLLGNYPATEPLKNGRVASDLVEFDFAEFPTVHKGFKPAVRELAFDVFEMAIVTFLMAKARGVPITLLPALVMGRYQHEFLLYNAERGTIGPKDLEGKRVAVRAWTVSTVMWTRGLLANEYGVDLDAVQWFTQEDAHVPNFNDPLGVTRLPAEADLKEMLLAGDVDAAIIPGKHNDSRLKTVIPDAADAAEAWAEKHDALHVNHYLAVTTGLATRDPAAVAEVYRMFGESKKLAGLPEDGKRDFNLMGIEANRKSLEIAIDYCVQQGLIPERYAVEDLFEAGIS